MAVTARAGCLLVLFLVSVVYGKGPIKIASITRDSPSSNTHIVYDTTQVKINRLIKIKILILKMN